MFTHDWLTYILNLCADPPLTTRRKETSDSAKGDQPWSGFHLNAVVIHGPHHWAEPSGWCQSSKFSCDALAGVPVSPNILPSQEAQLGYWRRSPSFPGTHRVSSLQYLRSPLVRNLHRSDGARHGTGRAHVHRLVAVVL